METTGTEEIVMSDVTGTVCPSDPQDEVACEECQ